MVEALPANRADDTLHIGSLPGRTRRRQNFLDPHGLHVLPKFPAEDAIAVSQQVPRDLFKRKCRAELLPRPLRSRVCGHVEMHDPCGSSKLCPTTESTLGPSPGNSITGYDVRDDSARCRGDRLLPFVPCRPTPPRLGGCRATPTTGRAPA